jgi:probable rRNA maturation factor
MPVVIDNRQRRVPISRTRLARATQRALDAVGRPAGEVELALVDDAEIRRLNAAFRGIRRRTDVLAFPLEAPDAPGQLVGQVVVSAETAARQARRVGVPVAAELDLLVTHATLHLVGYDDRDPIEADMMHRRERDILGPEAPACLWRGLLAMDRATPDRETRARGTPDRGAQPRRARTGRPRLEPASHP